MAEVVNFRYPLDGESRRALRERHMMRAARRALHVGQSQRCEAGDHARLLNHGNGHMRDGCRNDGSTCLCWCHDEEAERG